MARRRRARQRRCAVRDKAVPCGVGVNKTLLVQSRIRDCHSDRASEGLAPLACPNSQTRHTPLALEGQVPPDLDAARPGEHLRLDFVAIDSTELPRAAC